MLDPAGRGDKQWGGDVSASIAKWGTWQASMAQEGSDRRVETEAGAVPRQAQRGRKMASAGGRHQASTMAPRKPSVVDALVGALGIRSNRAMLVDVGAGQGLFSLAAAARGYRAVAFEASPPSIASLKSRCENLTVACYLYLSAISGKGHLHLAFAFRLHSDSACSAAFATMLWMP